MLDTVLLVIFQSEIDKRAMAFSSGMETRTDIEIDRHQTVGRLTEKSGS